jgi:uncharacterized protein (TIGR03083 family)
MALKRTVVVPGLMTEYADFSELLRSLSDEEWAAPSRCTGWSVADVAGHVVGTLTDITQLRLEGLGSPEVTQRQVEERRGRKPGALADELEEGAKAAAGLAAGFDDEAWEAEGPQGGGQTLGFGLEALWFDTYLHADDIRASVGRPMVTGPGVAPSVSHLTAILTEQGWGPATIDLDGLDNFEVSGGGGRTVTGDPMAFILAATGRSDPGPLGLDETVNIYR